MQISKIKKRLLAFFLTLTMIFALSQPTNAFAAGTETWYKGSYEVGAFNMVSDNLTPVKTLGDSGALLVSFSFYRTDPYSSSPIKLTMQIRNADTGYVYETVVVKETEADGGFIFLNNMTAGTRLQIYFDASSISNPPGPYRCAHISYGYTLS